MPTWLLPLLMQLPAILADIGSIIQAIEGGTATPEQRTKLQVYSGLMKGINDTLSYHVGV